MAQTISRSKRALLEQRIRGVGAERRDTAPAVVRRGAEGPARLSLAQEQLWYFSQLVPDNPVYNEVVSIRKTGPLDVDSLRRAFHEIVRRHEIWHTTFAVQDGVPVQVVGPGYRLDLPLTDLSSLPPVDREARAVQIVAEMARRPYQLSEGPLIRPLLVRFSSDDHCLYIALHHLVFDGFSISRIILPELVALYKADREGRADVLSPPPLQYADYAEWEQGWSRSAEMRRRLDFWRRQLGGIAPQDLPLDHPRPPRQRFRGAMVELRYPAEIVRRLRSVAHGAGGTLFQLVAGAFAVLLSRYSGEDDVVLGTMVDLRQQPELEAMVGYCATPVALRIDLSGDPTFSEVMKRTREVLLGALENKVPFERLVREVQPKRDPSMNPIYQSMLVIQPQSVAVDPSWSLEQLDSDIGNEIGHAKLDLHVELDERTDGELAGRLIYNRDIFDGSTAQRVVAHFGRLLADIASDPTRRLSDFSLLSDAELHRQVVEWNATETAYPRDLTLHELIASQAARKPDAIAVQCAGVRMTYGELDRRSNRVAHGLRAAGVRTGDLVAICVPRSLDMLVGMLGILKAGAAYVPLDPNYPADRLVFMVQDSGARVAVTQSGVPVWLAGLGVGVVAISEVVHKQTQMDAPVNSSATHDDLAYVIYTSGSTGKPKGVRIPHRAVVNLIYSMARTPGLGAADRVLAITTYSFDIAVVELWLPLAQGALIELAPADVLADPRSLIQLFEESKPTFMQATPATWRMLVEGGWKGDAELVALAGGEAVDRQLADEILARCRVLWNVYGPTETTVWSTLGPIERGGRVSIGRPIANTSVYVLDPRLRPQPVGVPGEIYIGGDGVARGYLNRPELTEERFVPDPFRPGTRMYRTGDIGRFWSDGRIEHLGRADNQVKVRGYRIETGEIEVALLRSPNVASVAVVARDDHHGEKQLVAYVVPTADAAGSLDTAGLRALLRKTLPDFMVPSQFVRLDALPMTPNGKVDRKALPTPEATAPHGGNGYVAPRSALEQQLSEIWAQVLGAGRVGADDDFFELGGHSLLAVRLMAEVRRVLGVEVSVASFLSSAPTVAGMAKVIAAGQTGGASQLLFNVQPHGSKPPLFFVHSHETSMLTLRHFTRFLGTDQPVIALLPERHDMRFDRSSSVERIAAGLVDAIRSVQTHGPYYIGGHSFGGIIAYEIARQLRNVGEELAWVCILDAGTPAEAARWLEARLNPKARLGRLRRLGLKRAPAKVLEVVRRESNEVLVGIGKKLDPLGESKYDWEGAIALVVKYVPVGTDAPVEIIAPTEQLMWGGSRYLGWEEIHRGTLAIFEVPGDHLSMLTEPRVDVLAELVTERLRAAQSRHEQLVALT